MQQHYQEELTEKIICCFYHVYNILGCGFLEKVYENALYQELQASGLSVSQQVPVQVEYKNEIVGDYCSDLLIEDKVIVEIKAHKALRFEHEAQLLNYLKATQVEIGLLLNFGPEPEVKRRAFSNKRK
jgi:GxxExxY protein